MFRFYHKYLRSAQAKYQMFSGATYYAVKTELFCIKIELKIWSEVKAIDMESIPKLQTNVFQR